MPSHATAYPDDLLQNREDRRNPPLRQSQALPSRDHARQNQGGGTTALGGGQRAAAPVLSAIAPIAGRDHLPADAPSEERHWDAPLPVVVRLAEAGGVELRTLRQAGAFASGQYMTLEHSPRSRSSPCCWWRRRAAGIRMISRTQGCTCTDMSACCGSTEWRLPAGAFARLRRGGMHPGSDMARVGHLS